MSAAAVLANVLAYSLQLGLLGGAGALLARAMRVRAPGAMLAYWQGLLAAALILPAVQPWRPAVAGASRVSWQTAGGPAAVSGSPLPIAPALAGVLAAGALLRGAWLLRGWRRLSRCRAEARRLDRLPPAAADLPARLGVRARFYVSEEVDVPAAFGLGRPVVLFPPAFLEMSPETQRAVAAHRCCGSAT